MYDSQRKVANPVEDLGQWTALGQESHSILLGRGYTYGVENDVTNKLHKILICVALCIAMTVHVTRGQHDSQRIRTVETFLRPGKCCSCAI